MIENHSPISTMATIPCVGIVHEVLSTTICPVPFHKGYNVWIPFPACPQGLKSLNTEIIIWLKCYWIWQKKRPTFCKVTMFEYRFLIVHNGLNVWISRINYHHNVWKPFTECQHLVQCSNTCTWVDTITTVNQSRFLNTFTFSGYNL